LYIVQFNKMDVEMVQTINSVLASICGLTLHCYILYKLLRNHSSLSQYQNLIVVQSAVGAVYAVVQLIANEVRMTTLFGETSFFLVMIFNIHRVLMLVRYLLPIIRI
uniref:Sugar transporter SWEET1 n=1 Tax=Haemonchus placei TaxID=6290 RepID=A0A0N4W864_HAEPC